MEFLNNNNPFFYLNNLYYFHLESILHIYYIYIYNYILIALIAIRIVYC